MANQNPKVETAAEFMDAHIEIAAQGADRARRAKRRLNIAMAAGYAIGATGIGLEAKELLTHDYITGLNELYTGVGVAGFTVGVGAHIRMARHRLTHNRLAKRLASFKKHKDKVESGDLDQLDTLDIEGIESFEDKKLDERCSIEDRISLEEDRAKIARENGKISLKIAGGGVASGFLINQALEAADVSVPTTLVAGFAGGLAGSMISGSMRSFEAATQHDDRVVELQTQEIITEYDLSRSYEALQAQT